MANAQRGEVGLDVEGVRYTLQPTFNGICDLEERTGKTFIEIATAAQANSLVALRQLIWAYLQPHHAAEITTFVDAGDWVTRAGGITVVQEALTRAIALNTADQGGAAASDPRRAQVGTGVDSISEPVGSV